MIHTPRTNRWIIAMTGASGTCYGRRLLQALVEQYPEMELEVVLSEAALRVMREEEGLQATVGRTQARELIGITSPNVRIHSNRNIGASIASGSYKTDGMVIVPCSMKTLAAVRIGYCDNLIQRAADVVLKEHRRLVLVPRETPLSQIHLENMLALSNMGAAIVPAMPGFYQQPKTIAELVDMQVMKIADQMGLSLDLVPRWGEVEQPTLKPVQGGE